MKRREFLQITAVGGSALAAAGLSACEPKSEAKKKKKRKKSPPPFELDELTVAALQEGMASGKYSARKLVEMYLERIERVDKGDYGVNSVIEINPDAEAIAHARDAERRENNIRGPLHGIPVMIKDNIDTADKMMTTAGSLALSGSIAAQDSYVAQKLREAGAIILGKTNLSEWANFRSTRSTSGWSGRGGQTNNPYALDRNPCGSSSGSGAAVSANLCTITIGTETNGSVVCPSSANGIVGIKPTVGLVGRSGIIPIAHTQDTAGPMARTVRDAAIMLGALTGIDPRDDITNESKGNSHTDYTQFLDPNGLKGTRIGVARNYFGFHPGVDQLMEDAIAAIKELGAEVIDPANIETRGEYGNAGFEVLLYEFKTDLNKYFMTVNANHPVRSLEALIQFNEENKDASMPYFGQEILIMAQERGDLSSPEYIDALKKVRELSRDKGIDATMGKDNLDAIIAPTGGPAWYTDWVNGDHFGGSSSSPAARSGYPNITVPAGFIHGLPVGISMFSRPYTEPQLIKYAYAFEQATNHRRAPEFLAHVDYGA